MQTAYDYKGIRCFAYYHPGSVFSKPGFKWHGQIEALAAKIGKT